MKIIHSMSKASVIHSIIECPPDVKGKSPIMPGTQRVLSKWQQSLGERRMTGSLLRSPGSMYTFGLSPYFPKSVVPY